jgi:hypothetical protein
VRAEFKFLQTSGGVTRFVKATVDSAQAATWEVVLSDAVTALSRVYGDTVVRGVSAAIAEHERRGGPPHRVQVIELIETAADTSADVVQCAVTVATWKSFGHGEGDVVAQLDAGLWHALFV